MCATWRRWDRAGARVDAILEAEQRQARVAVPAGSEEAGTVRPNRKLDEHVRLAIVRATSQTLY